MPVDALLEPGWNHGGYCETTFTLSLKTGLADGQQLRTRSKRTCHMPLDQAEIAAGESDVAMHECRQGDYLLGDDAIQSLSTDRSGKPCPQQ